MSYLKDKCIIKSYLQRDFNTGAIKVLYEVTLINREENWIESGFTSLEAAFAYLEMYKATKYREEFYI